ncbi:MAG TPA: hypothetical protein VFZ44_11855 [Pyrinomonadaceae bacterium]
MMSIRLASVIKSALGVAVLVTAALSAGASAQQPQPPGASAQASPTPPRPARTNEVDANADVSITARVTADSLRFEKVPNPRVEFTGKPERVTVWEAERENLPRPVQPGVTYRNVGITLRITSVFADIDRIVAEALGEVPVNDAAPPTPARPSPTPPEQPAAAPTPAPTTPPAKAAASAPRRGPARGRRGN